MARFLDPQNLSQLSLAIDALKKDETVAVPTETVYGLAGNGFSETALARIFERKERPHFDPLILHIPLIMGADPMMSLEQSGAITLNGMNRRLRSSLERVVNHF